MINKGSITVVGIGTHFDYDNTAAFQRALTNATRIMTIIREPKSTWLDLEFHDLPIEVLSEAYRKGINRQFNYEIASDKVITSAKQGEHVCFVTYGSPVTYDRVATLIRLKAIEQHIPCVVYSGVSSIDSILGFIGEDMAPGLQIVEARWAIRSRYRPDPKLALLLMQIGAIWTDEIPELNDSSTNKLNAIRDFLLLYFPNNHLVIFVRAPVTIADSGYLRISYLEDINSGPRDDILGTSLFVPAMVDPDQKRKHWYQMFVEQSR